MPRVAWHEHVCGLRTSRAQSHRSDLVGTNPFCRVCSFYCVQKRLIWSPPPASRHYTFGKRDNDLLHIITIIIIQLFMSTSPQRLAIHAHVAMSVSLTGFPVSASSNSCFIKNSTCKEYFQFSFDTFFYFIRQGRSI